MQPEFKLLSAWFSSLFLYPILELKEAGIFARDETPATTDDKYSQLEEEEELPRDEGITAEEDKECSPSSPSSEPDLSFL